jgi:cytochrome c5
VRAETEDPMSDPQQHPAGAPHHQAHEAHEPDEHHEGPIKTPQQLIWTVVAAFVVPIVIIILLVNYVAFGTQPAAGSEGLGEEAVARRLQPVGTVAIRDASAPAVVHTGEQVYAGQCAACHTAGVAGAPKLGDTAAWAPRVAAGYEAMLNSVLKGKGAMAPQGGGAYSDYEIARAVVYLSNQGGARFDEPAAPAAAASAPN